MLIAGGYDMPRIALAISALAIAATGLLASPGAAQSIRPCPKAPRMKFGESRTYFDYCSLGLLLLPLIAEIQAEPLRHPIQRSPIDPENLRRFDFVSPRLLEHPREMPLFNFVQGQ